ncbi:UPF0481 protein At3g47200-like [Aristolochia californica]|uniref:UPF0481 protein At3g47200-like n=1 Tax=Aristolochia californica TaxID=171875 RepID=UPI0035E1589A
MNVADEVEQRNNDSIHRVPSHICDLNKKAYQPQLVSFVIENQLPLRLLLKLVATQTGEEETYYSNSLGIIRSATELHETGVRFKKSKTDCLMYITFRNGVLRLPPISVNDETECSLLNLMALERLHNGTGYEITSYVFFMDNILDSPRDVNLLRYRGILKRALGSDEALAKLFNRLSKDIAPDIDPNFPLLMIHRDLNKYCKNSWNKWKANLRHNYLFNPWVTSSVAAAVLLLLLGISQTVYTILGYHKPPG